MVQVHISPRQNHVVRLLHLDEAKEGESDSLFPNPSVNRRQKLKPDFAFDVNPAAFLPHGGLERLTRHHWLREADLGGGGQAVNKQ